MERFSDFRIVNVEKNICPGSIYFNKKMLLDQSRIATYFELYFAKNITNQISPYIYGNIPEKGYHKLFDEFIMRKIGAMGECMYEEKYYNQDNGKTTDFTGFRIDHEENKKILKFILTCKLINVYYSRMVHLYSINKAEKIFEGLMYDAMIYWKVDDVFDYIVTRGEKIEEPKETSKGNRPNQGTPLTFSGENNNNKKEPQFKVDYNFNRNKEITLFKTILNYSMFLATDASFKRILLNNYKNTYKCFERTFFDLNNVNFNVLNIIRDTMLKISMIKMDLEIKDKVLKSLQKILEEDVFKEENNFLNMQAALEYGENRRPISSCENLVETYGDKYKYVGKVYHGFRDMHGYNRSAEDILKKYNDGFISCSKDIRVAKNFAMCDDYDCYNSPFGGVIEIMIREEDVSVDIEQVLKDEYANNSMLYTRLYENFLREKEVMVKVPIISYNIIYKDEVNKMIQEIEEKEKREKEEA